MAAAAVEVEAPRAEAEAVAAEEAEAHQEEEPVTDDILQYDGRAALLVAVVVPVQAPPLLLALTLDHPPRFRAAAVALLEVAEA